MESNPPARTLRPFDKLRVTGWEACLPEAAPGTSTPRPHSQQTAATGLRPGRSASPSGICTRNLPEGFGSWPVPWGHVGKIRVLIEGHVVAAQVNHFDSRMRLAVFAGRKKIEEVVWELHPAMHAIPPRARQASFPADAVDRPPAITALDQSPPILPAKISGSPARPRSPQSG